VEKTRERTRSLYELRPIGRDTPAILLKSGLQMLGHSEACDVIIKHKSIDPINSVIEIKDGMFRIFDMKSRLGTFVNNNKVISQEIKLNDRIKIGDLEYEFSAFSKAPLPPLEVLNPQFQKPSFDRPLPGAKPTEPPAKKRLEQESKKKDTDISYPLSLDPKAEFSEYIFEDDVNIYPIFKYDVSTRAIEIIILFKDKVLSVDYLPLKNTTYNVVGRTEKLNEIEFPYLGKETSQKFVEIAQDEIFIHKLPGFDIHSLDKNRKLQQNETFLLNTDDILFLEREDMRVFLRRTDNPPKVHHAPIFGRDKDLRKYLLPMLFMITFIIGGLSSFEVDNEKEKEKNPKRIATILYKKKLEISKSKAITKTEKKPKKIVQKSPKQEQIQKKKVVQKTKPKEKVKVKAVQRPAKKVVKKVSPQKRVARKAPPKKAQVNRLKPKVTNSVRPGSPKKAVSKTTSSNAIKNKSKGHLQAYKSFDFKSNINSLLAKGGAGKSLSVKKSSTDSFSGTSIGSGSDSATLKKANVSQKIGSLSGSVSGKLDTNSGFKGLVKKKNIITAGLPFKTVVLGGMDPDVIRRILEEHVPQFRYCYQKVLDPGVKAYSGVVKLNFIIGASGHVSRATTQGVSNNLPGSIRKCVSNVLLGIKFPAPAGGGVVEVNQPFNFYPNKI
jgi:hypothetical protein